MKKRSLRLDWILSGGDINMRWAGRMGLKIDRDIVGGSLALNLLFALVCVALYFFPVLASISMGSAQVNYYQGLVFLLVAVGLFSGAVLLGKKQGEALSRSGQLLLVIFVTYLIGWMLTGTPAPVIDRFIMLFGAVALYVVLLALYDNNGSLLYRLFYIKFVVVFAVSVFFVIFVLFFQEPDFKLFVKPHPPVYSHLRHLNYDLFFAIPIAIMLLNRFGSRIVWVACLMVLAMVAIWTAGRGMFVGLLVSVAVVMLRIWKHPPLNTIVAVVIVFLGAGFIVSITGYDYFLDRTVMQTVEGNSLNGISSGRLVIWERSLQSFSALDNIGMKVFGFGPDAFMRMGVWPGNIVQPHSAPIQVLLEFGIFGIVCFGFFTLIWIYRAFFLVLKSSRDIDVLAGVLLIGGLVFSLVDGIFYHANALTMMLILISFVNHRYSVACSR